MAQNDGWGRAEPLEDATATSLIASSQGLPGSGKSHFWATAPDPIAWFLFDPGGLKGFKANRVFRGKDIRVFDYCGEINVGKLPPEERVQRSIEALDKFKEEWDLAVKKARTLVIDKESMLWEVMRYAFDEVRSPDPKSFHELNLMYRGWVQDAENNGINFGMIRDMHDTWGKVGVSKSSGNVQMGFTGKFIPDGQKYVPGLVQINLEHRWDDEDREFKVKILEKCRLGNAVDLIGTESGGLDFLGLVTMLYPEMDPEEWGIEL